MNEHFAVIRALILVLTENKLEEISVMAKNAIDNIESDFLECVNELNGTREMLDEANQAVEEIMRAAGGPQESVVTRDVAKIPAPPIAEAPPIVVPGPPAGADVYDVKETARSYAKAFGTAALVEVLAANKVTRLSELGGTAADEVKAFLLDALTPADV